MGPLSEKNRTFLEMYGTGGQKKIHGASFPAEIWHDYMAEALKNEPAKDFPTPEPIGEIVNDVPSASPTPTPSVTLTSPSPSPTPSETLTSPSPSASESCKFSWQCTDTGGTDTGGTDGGVTSSPTATDTSGTGNNRGNGNGGLFGGPAG